MPENIFFFLGISLILMHEMDAIRCKEWRIFPGLSFLNDNVGFVVFMFAHIPLYYFLLAAVYDPAQSAGIIRGLNIFFIIHLGLHILFLWHPKNEFKDWISWVIIAGSGTCGALGVLLQG